jgi:hypothetical protein
MKWDEMHKPLEQVAAFVAVVPWLLACSDTPVGPVAAALSTDAASYVAMPNAPLGGGYEYTFSVIAPLTNNSANVVSLSRCAEATPSPIYRGGVVGQVTTSAFDPGGGCPAGLWYRVPAGSTRVDTLPLRGPWGGDGVTGEALGVFEGDFRLVYLLYGDSDGPVTVHSNVFSVSRLAQGR